MTRKTLLNLSNNVRTLSGKSVHTAGMVAAAALLATGIYLAIVWGMPYGSFALMSAFMHATAVYLIGRSLRRIIDRRSVRRPREQGAS